MILILIPSLRKSAISSRLVSSYLNSYNLIFPLQRASSLHKSALQYIATQSSFILGTVTFLPPALREGLWVVGDEKKRAPAARVQQSP